jgi:hypothetical protein
MAEAMANEMDALDRALNTQAPKPQVPEDLREDYADALPMHIHGFAVMWHGSSSASHR